MTSLISNTPAPEDPNTLITPPEPAPAPPPPPPAAPAPETFSREYVEEIRREAAGYRTRLNPYEQLFDGMDEDTVEGWKNLISLAKDGNPEAIDLVAETFGLQKPEGPQYLTAEAAEAIASKKLEEFRAEQAIEQVYRDAEGLGYQRNTEDMVRLLWHLNQMDEPDIKAADKAVKDARQAVINEYLQVKGEQSGKVPIQPEGGPAAVPKEDTSPRTMAQAREAAQARIRAIQSGRG